MKQRVLTAACLIPPVLLALTSTRLWPIGLLALALLISGLHELKGMLAKPGLVLGIAWIIPFAIVSWPIPQPAFGVTVCLWGFFATAVGVAAAYYLSKHRDRGGAGLGILATGWLVGPLESLVALHRMGTHTAQPWNAATPVLLATVPLWAGDTAAIFAGRAFGKHPLAPKISPKKTWEGAIANLLACVAISIPLGCGIGYSVVTGLICGLAAGVLGQAGDLFESYVKRQAGVKDSGRILPGHGGVLDRIDSILFTAPMVALVLVVFGYR